MTYSSSPKGVVPAEAGTSATGACPQKPSYFFTSTSPNTVHWQASRRNVDAGPCGGSPKRNFSLKFCGETAESALISTAHVPQVPRPRQLIILELPLCGETPRRSSAVRSSSPLRTPSKTRSPSAVSNRRRQPWVPAAVRAIARRIGDTSTSQTRQATPNPAE